MGEKRAMMINKRLIGTVSESKKYVAGNVVFQWCSLAANIAMMTSITRLLASLAKQADFLRSEKGLDTPLAEKASNLSGGQCQRLALARALLHDSPVYIFDESASNIDVESENDIMAEIHGLAGQKTVILISHRLANVTVSDRIYVMERGVVSESGSHEELLAKGGVYGRLWKAQQDLENYGRRDGEAR